MQFWAQWTETMQTEIQHAVRYLESRFPEAVLRREGRLWRVYSGNLPLGQAYDNADDAVISAAANFLEMSAPHPQPEQEEHRSLEGGNLSPDPAK
jgi:hypothetical protein